MAVYDNLFMTYTTSGQVIGIRPTPLLNDAAPNWKALDETAVCKTLDLRKQESAVHETQMKRVL